MKFDLHVHSKYSSDGLNKPDTMLKVAKKLGLGIAILDHNNTKAWPELKRLSRELEVPVIFGEEIKTTFQGKKAGELAGLFLNEEIKAREYSEVIDEIKEQGGVVMVPHPFDVLRKNFKFLKQEKKRLDVIEVLNARCYRTKYNEQALAFALKNGLNKSAGSDAHTLGELGQAFAASPAKSIEDFRKDLLKNNVQIVGERSSMLVHLWTPVAKLSPGSLYQVSKTWLKNQFS